ncbi:MAG: glycosyltransferase [Bryobacteraceae bacterium]
MHCVITIPVFRDWESAAVLCDRIDDQLASLVEFSFEVLLVDDGSLQAPDGCFEGRTPRHLRTIEVLTLRRNLGHQRAIAIGLSYIQNEREFDAVLVMDADGEDRPEDIKVLLSEYCRQNQESAVFAERGRRVETLQFKFFYQCYRFLHYLMTGTGIRLGNFSVLPKRHLDGLVAFPELWNHYAATVLKSRLPYVCVRADRGKRLRGKSQMNFVSLVIHGLSALFSYQELVSTRILIVSALCGTAIALLMLGLLALRVFTSLPIPGWTTLSIGLLLILVAQLLTTSLAVIFSVMMNRSQLGFLPLRDYSYFILGHRLISSG